MFFGIIRRFNNKKEMFLSNLRPKCRRRLSIVTIVFVGVMVLLTGAMLNEDIRTSVLHSNFLSDGKDGSAPPDYRFIDNHHVETADDVQSGIVMPSVIAEATEHRCGVLIQRLGAGRLLGKFDVGYMVVCFDKYPTLFKGYFDEFMDKYPIVGTTSSNMEESEVTTEDEVIEVTEEEEVTTEENSEEETVTEDDLFETEL